MSPSIIVQGTSGTSHFFHRTFFFFERTMGRQTMIISAGVFGKFFLKLNEISLSLQKKQLTGISDNDKIQTFK